MGMIDQAGVIWFGPVWASLKTTCTTQVTPPVAISGYATSWCEAISAVGEFGIQSWLSNDSQLELPAPYIIASLHSLAPPR